MVDQQKPEYVKLWEWCTRKKSWQFIYDAKKYDFDGCIGTTTDLEHLEWYSGESSSSLVPDLTIDTAENERILREGIEQWIRRQCDGVPAHKDKSYEFKLSQEYWADALWYASVTWEGSCMEVEACESGGQKTFHAALLALARKLMAIDKKAEDKE